MTTTDPTTTEPTTTEPTTTEPTTATSHSDRPAPTDGSPGPERIMQVASGFMAAKHLFAANELGVFEALADSPATLNALAARVGLTSRAASISADAMVALGLLERRGDVYANGPAAAHYLAGTTPADLRPLLRFWDTISYRTWEGLAHALGRGPDTEVFDLDDDQQEILSAGIEAVLAGPAHALAVSDALRPGDRLLDVGGGTGSWSMAAARHQPGLQATVVDLPVTAGIARRRIAAAGLDDRVTVVASNAMVDDLPPGFDVFLVANLVHYWSPADNQRLLRRIRAAATVGARLLLADFWTDPGHTEPLHAALMAGEFAVHLRDGDVYSVEEVRGWLPTAGWRFTAHRPLAGPQSLVIAEAV
jgi:SAM-dependent methyltransferase